MKPFIILFFLAISQITVSAQQHNIDTVKIKQNLSAIKPVGFSSIDNALTAYCILINQICTDYSRLQRVTVLLQGPTTTEDLNSIYLEIEAIVKNFRNYELQINNLREQIQALENGDALVAYLKANPLMSLRVLNNVRRFIGSLKATGELIVTIKKDIQAISESKQNKDTVKNS